MEEIWSMKLSRFNINIKEILNTVLLAFFTIVVYWMIVIMVEYLPDWLWFVVADHFELAFIILGGVNFVIYCIFFEKNRHQNILLYYVSAVLWNTLLTYGGRGELGLLLTGVYIEIYSLTTLGILFFIYFIVLRYLDYIRKEGK